MISRAFGLERPIRTRIQFCGEMQMRGDGWDFAVARYCDKDRGGSMASRARDFQNRRSHRSCHTRHFIVSIAEQSSTSSPSHDFIPPVYEWRHCDIAILWFGCRSLLRLRGIHRSRVILCNSEDSWKMRDASRGNETRIMKLYVIACT
jgi:hypothetical protein